MLTNSRIKLINQLKQKKHREKNGLFITEGSRNTLDFLASNFTSIELFGTQEWIDDNLPHLNSVIHSVVTKKDLKKISALTNPSDVLAIFELPKPNENPKLYQDSLSIALDDIHDPGNMGTIIRTADWFGIKTIYCSENSVDAFNPKVVQATMGSLSRVKIHYINLKDFLVNKPASLPIFGALLEGQPLNEIKHQDKGIILIGSEAHGISKELIQYIDNRITIPLFNLTGTGHPESLNASIACAIICYALQIRN